MYTGRPIGSTIFLLFWRTDAELDACFSTSRSVRSAVSWVNLRVNRKFDGFC